MVFCTLGEAGNPRTLQSADWRPRQSQSSTESLRASSVRNRRLKKLCSDDGGGWEHQHRGHTSARSKDRPANSIVSPSNIFLCLGCYHKMLPPLGLGFTTSMPPTGLPRVCLLVDSRSIQVDSQD